MMMAAMSKPNTIANSEFMAALSTLNGIPYRTGHTFHIQTIVSLLHEIVREIGVAEAIGHRRTPIL
jgi:hypothetical protein